MRKFDDCDSCVFDGVESGVCIDCDDANQWEEDLDSDSDDASEALKIVDETQHNHPATSAETTEGNVAE